METEWRGFQLHPEVPPGGTPVAALFGKQQASEFTSYLARFAETFGVPLSQPDHVPNTRRALGVTELARDRDVLEPFRDAVMAAHWVHGENIESDETLARIAKSVGLDVGAALTAADDPQYQRRLDEAREEADARGVTGIPTFYFDDLKVVGCRSYDDLARSARQAGFKPARNSR